MKNPSRFALDDNFYTVYALVDPRDDTLRYIGITNDVYRRFIEHVRCTGSNQKKNEWIASMKVAQVMVEMRVIDRALTLSEAKQKEDEWIHRLLAEGSLLLNIEGVARPEPKIRSITMKLGRQFGREEVGEIIIYRLVYGYWPQGLSRKMQLYYEKQYLDRKGRYYRQAGSWRAEARRYKTALNGQFLPFVELPQMQAEEA